MRSDIGGGAWSSIAGRKPAPADVSSVTAALNFPPTTKEWNPLGVISEGFPWIAPVLIVSRYASRAPGEESASNCETLRTAEQPRFTTAGSGIQPAAACGVPGTHLPGRAPCPRATADRPAATIGELP